jgi:ankyrin repeat protein
MAIFGFFFRDQIYKWYYIKKLEHRSTPFSDKAFLEAAAGGKTDVVSLFLKAGIARDVKNEKGQTALAIAAEKGHDAVAGLLVQTAPALLGQSDAAGMTPLMTAAFHGKEKAVRLLVESGADVNQLVPGQEGAASVLQALLDAPDLTADHMNILRYLLEKGADIKARNASGRSPLHFAALHGRTDAAKLLREKGADVNEADNQGVHALHLAVLIGNAEFITFLADQGVNVKAAAADGQTELMFAARSGHVAACQALLDRGAEVDARTGQGATALTAASLAGNVDIVRLLLERGADPAGGALPDHFRTLPGKTLAVNAKKTGIHTVLKRIGEAAAQDGYALQYDSVADRKVSLKAKTAWNQVLIQAAGRNGLFLVVKDREVVVLPWNPSWRKRGAS